MMYILYYYYINILIPTFNSWIILSTNNFIVSMIIFFPLSHFFPFWRKQKPNYKHTKKKYYFTNLQNSYFKDIKNLKLNGATILDLSKKQKPETLIVVVKKKSMMGNCKSIYSCTTYVRHTSRKRRTWRENSQTLRKKIRCIFF